MVNFVLIVPKQTLNVLLVSWLSLSDVGKLDAALCDRACRDIFEHSLALRNFGGATDIQFGNTSFISWIIKRKVKLDSLLVEATLLRRLNVELRYQLLESVGPTLRRVTINCGKDVKFNSAYFTDKIDHSALKTSDDSNSDSDMDNNPDASSESESDSDSNSDSVRFTTVGRIGRDSGGAQDANHAVEIRLIDGVITDLTLRCTMLETITVLGHHSGSIVPLLQMNPKLRCVTLRNCSKVLRNICNLCPNIASIVIKEHASSKDQEQFALKVPQELKQLCLPYTRVGKVFLKAVLACASLVELRISEVKCNWGNLTGSCPNLEFFRCVVLSDQLKVKVITKLSKVMPNLRTLILLKETSQVLAVTVLEMILASFPALRQLCFLRGLEKNLCATHQKPPAPARVDGAYQLSIYPLEELYLDNKGYSSLHDTLAKCPALHTLGLSYGPQDLKHFTPCVKRIFCLSLDYADAQGLTIFRNLDELLLGYCVQLTDRALVSIAEQCPALTLLLIRNAPKVTLKSVLAVLKLCPQLCSLEMENYAANLRGKDENGALAAVMKLCRLLYPQLQHISL
eukprot:gene13119-15123_t